jgi:hypothetical protein
MRTNGAIPPGAGRHTHRRPISWYWQQHGREKARAALECGATQLIRAANRRHRRALNTISSFEARSAREGACAAILNDKVARRAGLRPKREGQSTPQLMEPNMAGKEPLLHTIADNNPPATEEKAEAVSIVKPSTFSLEKFKSKRAATVANVETLQTGLPHHNIAHAKDFVRLHPNEEAYWTPELCFVNVPIKGQKRDTLHLINEDLAMRYLPSGRIQHFRLALATKPFDVFFLCQIPTRNEDNNWNASNLLGCEKAKTAWVQATSRKEEGVEAYKIDVARDADAFPEPKWPEQSLADLIDKTFAGRMVDREDHPALLRLIVARRYGADRDVRTADGNGVWLVALHQQ